MRETTLQQVHCQVRDPEGVASTQRVLPQVRMTLRFVACSSSPHYEGSYGTSEYSSVVQVVSLSCNVNLSKASKEQLKCLVYMYCT